MIRPARNDLENKMNFTPEQQKSILARNPQVLVSAAAGSGKTTVLIERILSMMREGISIDQMIVVTFTRASAADMRAKLIRALDESDDPLLREQSMLVNRADICTLHVLCSRLIRRHFQAAGIDPMSRVAEKYLLDPLYDRAYDQVLETVCADPDPDDRRLLDSFTFSEIREMSDECRRFICSAADPDEWTEKALDRDDLSRYFDEMRFQAKRMLPGLTEKLTEMRKLLYQPGGPLPYEISFLQDEKMIWELEHDILEDKICDKQFSASFANIGRIGAKDQVDPELQERYKKLRDKLKKDFSLILSCIPADMEKEEEAIRFTMPAFSSLVRITQKTDLLYSRFKREKNYLDYNDLEHLALKVLNDETIRLSICRNVRAIFVDECQDISALQDAILSRLVTPETCYFMVGDVKQSIYRFRLADPTLFQQKYRIFSFDETAEKRKIILQNNFRSDLNILECVNRVFSFAMREKATELEYDHEAELRPGPETHKGSETELILFRNDSDEPENTGEKEEEEEDKGEQPFGYRYEAAFMVEKIQSLVRSGLKDESGKIQPVRYRDIAILIRNASGRAPVIAKILSSSGIPVYSDADKQFYDLPEVSDVLSILKVIDNPYRDIPLIAALHCPCFSFSNQDLALIRLHSKKETPFYTLLLKRSSEDSPLGARIRTALEILKKWRFLASQMTVESLLYTILRESGLYARCGALEDGDLRQADLRLLCEQAAACDSPCDLGAFLRSVENVRIADDEKTAKNIGENEDVVRIMTMHKSKGLEFNVVFLCETARTFRNPSSKALFDPVLGGAIRYIDPDNRINRKTENETFAFRSLLSKKKREQIAEECRLLYVAMTRAKKKLYLLGSPSGKNDCFALSSPPGETGAFTVSCMLDWVCRSLYGYIDPENDTVFTIENGGSWSVHHQKVSDLSFRSDHPDFSFEPDDTPLTPDMCYYMERTSPSLSPLKLSVSSVVKKLRSEEDMEETSSDKRKTEGPSLKPDFLTTRCGMTSAEKGTLTHKALGCVDYDLYLSSGMDAALDMLYAKGILSDTEYTLLDHDMLSGFFHSTLGKRALSSPLVKREWPFNLRVKDNTILQGVIDLCFIEDGKWVLVDYKTDHCPAEELLHRYSLQINLYREAVERITEIEVRETHLFSLFTGKTVPVPLYDPFVDNFPAFL